MGNNYAALSLLMILLCSFAVSGLFQFEFKRYSYRKKGGNGRRYRLKEESCQNADDCLHDHGLNKEICLKTCISSSCYAELYSWDELEKGEIDVRFTSFKGCVVKQLKAKEMEEWRHGQL